MTRNRTLPFEASDVAHIERRRWRRVRGRTLIATGVSVKSTSGIKRGGLLAVQTLGRVIAFGGGVLAALNSLVFAFLSFLVLDLVVSTGLGMASVVAGFVGVFVWLGIAVAAFLNEGSARSVGGLMMLAAGGVFGQWALWQFEFGTIRVLSAIHLIAAGCLLCGGALVIAGTKPVKT